MIIKLSLFWWYGHGMKWAWRRAVVDRVKASVEYFSLFALIRTLFAPFKQTYTGQSGSDIGAFFRGLVDTTISRVVGFFVRSLLIFIGLIHALFAFVTGIAFLVIGPFLPVFLLVSVILRLVASLMESLHVNPSAARSRKGSCFGST
jgi:hypothetical protein